MKIFVSGTNTNVGKTHFCALLSKYYKNMKKSVIYIKIIQTGYPDDDDAKSVYEASKVKTQTLLFGKEPVAPYFLYENFPMDFVIDKINKSKADVVIIEGSGGLLVPLDKSHTFADLVSLLNLETIIVVPNKLGCINDTLLNLYYCKTKGINLKGFALNDYFFDGNDNFVALQDLTNYALRYKFKTELEVL
ncbi:dethiobiotin synthase [Desulfurella sp.]|uniref:dethiobiotin synthase n=1 Tax=Desulfurella sp. TaxID=1962857 RepID=UPI003D0F3D6F